MVFFLSACCSLAGSRGYPVTVCLQTLSTHVAPERIVQIVLWWVIFCYVTPPSPVWRSSYYTPLDYISFLQIFLFCNSSWHSKLFLQVLLFAGRLYTISSEEKPANLAMADWELFSFCCDAVIVSHAHWNVVHAHWVHDEYTENIMKIAFVLFKTHACGTQMLANSLWYFPLS